MPQIAQQDHLYIDVSIDLDVAADVMSEVGPKLFECANAGTILDVVLRYTDDSGNVTLAPIVYAYLTDTDVVVSWVYEDGVSMGTYTQE